MQPFATPVTSTLTARILLLLLPAVLACGAPPAGGPGADSERDAASASSAPSNLPPEPSSLDLLSYEGIPQAAEDWSFVPLADAGAWFGLALAPEESEASLAGFVGPFVMTSGRWLGEQLAVLQIFDADRGGTAPLTGESDRRSRSRTGRLVHLFELDGLEVFLEGYFASGETALVTAHIHNPGTATRNLELGWAGELFPDQGEVQTGETGFAIHLVDGSRLYLDSDRPVASTEVEGTRYSMRLEEAVQIPPGEKAMVSLGLSFAPLDATPRDSRALAATLADTLEISNANHFRWADYLEVTEAAVLSDDPDSEAVRVIAIKAIQTLIGNWRGPAGRMRHSALFPSSNVHYFNGFWAWDSWKHAVALARIDPDLAASQVRAMFDHQDDKGMIADVVYLDPAEDNWRDTKPPLAGWAIEAVYEASGDLDFVRELYPKLVAYHRFWYAHRDHDGDGLCEYGSTDGTLVAARWESGMDNAVRFDDAAMLENGPGAWSMDRESVDLNSYLYREKVALAGLARALGEEEQARVWSDEAERLARQVRETMFDEETGWFYDTAIESGAPIPVQGPEGWIPLWAGLATPEQAERVRETMLDPAKFRTHVPFPTVARDHPEFSDGYWRGLVWLDQAYFAIEGLARYGYEDDARELTRQLFSNLQGAAVPGEPLYENYDALTGEGKNVRHFSWTAAHLLLLALDRSGI